MLPTVMISTQEPVVLKFFGSVSCTRYQFQKVCLNQSSNSISKINTLISNFRLLTHHTSISWCSANFSIKTIEITRLLRKKRSINLWLNSLDLFSVKVFQTLKKWSTVLHWGWWSQFVYKLTQRRSKLYT